jgi:hypothetical protein
MTTTKNNKCMRDIIKELIVNDEIFCFSDLSGKNSILQKNLNNSEIN